MKLLFVYKQRTTLHCSYSLITNSRIAQSKLFFSLLQVIPKKEQQFKSSGPQCDRNNWFSGSRRSRWCRIRCGGNDESPRRGNNCFSSNYVAQGACGIWTCHIFTTRRHWTVFVLCFYCMNFCNFFVWLSRQRIRRHLLIFSLAAPLLTVITYLGIGQKGKEALSSFNATGFYISFIAIHCHFFLFVLISGIAMLFSAGTFLYVATVHVLADITQNTHQASYSRLPNTEPIGYSRVSSVETGLKGPPSQTLKGLTLTELIILVIGCLMPLVLTVGHHHW